MRGEHGEEVKWEKGRGWEGGRWNATALCQIESLVMFWCS
jgi:hypothetical protein